MTMTQGNPAYFNHPVYITITVKWYYGPTGIAQYFPHRFGLMFPLPAKSIITTIVCIITDFYSLLVMTFISDQGHVGRALNWSSSSCQTQSGYRTEIPQKPQPALPDGRG